MINNEDNFNRYNNEQKSKVAVTKFQRYVIAFLFVGVLIIIFAFIMEAARRDNEDIPVSVNDPSQSMSESAIQRELDELAWVEQMLLPVNYFSRRGTTLEQVNAIVIHNIGNPNTTALQNRNYFANLEHTEERFASSNFIICLDGTIIQCVPVDEVAFASNQRNDDTLSIEVCHPDDTGRFTDESYAAVIRLTAWLCVRYGLTAGDVIRHHDAHPSTDCPRYFVLNPDAWERFKRDVQTEINNS